MSEDLIGNNNSRAVAAGTAAVAAIAQLL